MGDPFRKVASGEPLRISARAWNAMLEAAGLAKRTRDRDRDASRRMPQAGIVPISNVTGSDRERGQVLGLTAPLITPSDDEDGFLERITFSGSQPFANLHTGRYAILMEPIPAGEIGLGCIDGVCAAKLNVIATTDIYAELVDDEPRYLQSGPAGSARILWIPASEGEQWAIIRIGQPTGESMFKICAISPALKGYKLLGMPLGVPSWDTDETTLIHLGVGCIKANDVVAALFQFGSWLITSTYYRLVADP